MHVAISHRLPGRLRIAVPWINDEPVKAYRLQTKLEQIPGIRSVQCNPHTGRALILFDEASVSHAHIVQCIEAWMTQWDQPRAQAPAAEVAATLEAGTGVYAAYPVVSARDNPYRIPAIASSVLLGGLVLKRLFSGPSALALSPITFWASAGLSIVAGYPALRRGIENLLQGQTARPDLWLGLANLSMSAMRESLVSLSVVTAVNLAMYQRYTHLSQPQDTWLEPTLGQHTRKISRVSFWLSALALVFTRNPMCALGVALAGNPQPAILSHKFRWAQAEREALEQRLPLPQAGSLSMIRDATSVVLDERCLPNSKATWTARPILANQEPGKVLALAASLLQKCNQHPWKSELIQEVSEQGRSMHTPFQVEESAEGVRGLIKGHETLLGNRSFLEQHGIADPSVELEERRLRREGYQTQILVVAGQPVAVIGHRRMEEGDWSNVIHQLREHGFRVRTLGSGKQLSSDLERIAKDQLIRELEAGTVTILVGCEEVALEHPLLIRFAEIESHRFLQILRFCRGKGRLASHDIALLKIWNYMGMAMAFLSPAAASLTGLASDVLAMYFIAAQRWGSLLRGNERTSPEIAHVERTPRGSSYTAQRVLALSH
jgi:Ca2+-transporting ATPase